MSRLIACATVFVLALTIQVCLGENAQQARPEPITDESIASFTGKNIAGKFIADGSVVSLAGKNITDESVARIAGKNIADGSVIIIADKKVFWMADDEVQTAGRATAEGETLTANYPSAENWPRMSQTLPPMRPIAWPGDAAMTVPINAVELMARYEVNEFLADERLRPPKSLYLKGVVTRINAGGPEGNFIALRTDDLVADIRCYFSDRQAQRFRLVAKGDLATIRGSCAGRPLQDVIVYDCKIVTSVRPSTPFAPWEWPGDSSRRIRMREGFEFRSWPAGTQRYEVSRNDNVTHNSAGHTVRDGTDVIFTNNREYWRSVRSQKPAWIRQRRN